MYHRFTYSPPSPGILFLAAPTTSHPAYNLTTPARTSKLAAHLTVEGADPAGGEGHVLNVVEVEALEHAAWTVDSGHGQTNY